jgi:parallel beta-helix repeat protein
VKRSISRLLGLVGVLALASTYGLAATAQAAPGARTAVCGQTIRRNITLSADVGPCSRTDGLVVGADNVTVNLNGHSVLGDPAVQCDLTHPKPCDNVGIRVPHRTGVHVTNGTVKFFDAGIAIQGGAHNFVTNITATRNIGSGAGEYGDGIALDSTTRNVVSGNSVTFDGPFSGVGLPDGSTRNAIRENLIADNHIVRQQPVGQPPFNPAPDQEDNGIRVELFSSHNLIENNQILRSGSRGVNIVFDDTGNVIRGNTIADNGGQGVRASTRSDETVVENNTITGNGFDQYRLAIDLPATLRSAVDFVFAQKNRIVGNVINGNGVNGVEVGGGTGTGPNLLGGNLIQGNTVRGNGHNGIQVDCPVSENDFVTCLPGVAERNRIIGNATGANGANDQATNPPTVSYDLLDLNLTPCDHNVWQGNTFDTASPKCTTRK